VDVDQLIDDFCDAVAHERLTRGRLRIAEVRTMAARHSKAAADFIERMIAKHGITESESDLWH
jgi:hypothetical protein